MGLVLGQVERSADSLDVLGDLRDGVHHGVLRPGRGDGHERDLLGLLGRHRVVRAGVDGFVEDLGDGLRLVAGGSG